MEKEQILERWAEYIDDLFDDVRGERPSIKKKIDGPEITEEEIRFAVKKAKVKKAPGPDGVYTEMLKILDDFGIKRITDIANEIYNSGTIPDDLAKSVFVALPKEPGATKCELHRTISLMSHIIKLILTVLLQRLRRVIRPEISDVQCGFVKDKGEVVVD